MGSRMYGITPLALNRVYDKNYVIALYVRLSEEDEDVGIDVCKQESNSITNQRALLHQFLERHPEFANCTIIEKCDDGFSGVRFDNRPQFIEMIEMAKKGKIHCIIVKDFSRFGRDYVELGDYMEQIFPWLGVRFISVNDGYDSDTCIGETGSLDVQFKNLVYDYYSREMSKKQKIAWRRLAANGQYNSSHTVYGYKKDKADKHKLLIDDETAPVVKEIFSMMIADMPPIEICRSLNNRGNKSPATISIDRGIKIKWKGGFESYLWTPGQIERIIMDEVYLGNLVQLKSEVKVLGGKQIQKPKEEWIRRNGTHEAIVTQEEFDLANAKIKPFGKKKKRIHRNIYYCGKCGHLLQNLNYGTLRCRQSRFKSGHECMDIFMNKAEADQIVLTSIHNEASVFLDKEELTKASSYESLLSVSEQIISITRTIEAMRKSWFALYDKYSDGGISREQYVEQKKSYDEQIKKMETELLFLQQEESCSDDSDEEDAIELAKSYLGSNELTEEMKENLIERVIIYPDQRMEIVWAYRQ